MKVGNLVMYRNINLEQIGVIMENKQGYVYIHWLGDGLKSWEDNRDLQAVKKCP
jgi:hypothetical protein